MFKVAANNYMLKNRYKDQRLNANYNNNLGPKHCFNTFNQNETI